ncbi:unnamed protein product [Phaeothamnion confervicola]
MLRHPNLAKTLQDNEWAVLSDRSKGLIWAVLEGIPKAVKQYCLKHPRNALAAGLEGTKLVWEAARAANLADFNIAMVKLKRVEYPCLSAFFVRGLQAPGTHNFLLGENQPPACWALHVRWLPCYGQETNNWAESSVNWVHSEVREASPMEVLEDVCLKISASWSAKKQAGIVRQAEGELYTVESCKLFEKEQQQAGKYEIMPASATVFQALCQGKQQQGDMVVFTCTCRFLQQYNIACRHTIAVHVFKMNQPLQLSELIDSGFLVSQSIEAYDVSVFVPLLDELIRDEEIRPPLLGVQKGSKKRMASEAAGGGGGAAVSAGGGAASAGGGAAAGSGTRKRSQRQKRFPRNEDFNHTVRHAPTPAVGPVAMAADTAAAAAHAHLGGKEGRGAPSQNA